MSGGHFNYDQYRLGDICAELELLIVNNDSEEGRGYSKDTIEAFEEALFFLRTAFIYVQRIDWLVSDDDSEESFHRRLNQELAEEQDDNVKT